MNEIDDQNQLDQNEQKSADQPEIHPNYNINKSYSIYSIFIYIKNISIQTIKKNSKLIFV